MLVIKYFVGFIFIVNWCDMLYLRHAASDFEFDEKLICKEPDKQSWQSLSFDVTGFCIV